MLIVDSPNNFHFLLPFKCVHRATGLHCAREQEGKKLDTNHQSQLAKTIKHPSSAAAAAARMNFKSSAIMNLVII
jgi:hypothetical protein